MQFFVQPVATAKSAFLQLHEQRVLPCNVSCNLSSNLSLEDEVKVEVVFLLDIVRQVARGVLLQKSVAALPQSLRKVELDSTSCKACCNKNVARLDDCGICYTVQFLVQLVSQQNCETSCTKNYTV